MGVLIIDSEGNTIMEDNGDINKLPDSPQPAEEVDTEVPQLEEVIPDSNQIKEQRKREQAIIAQIIGDNLDV